MIKKVLIFGAGSIGNHMAYASRQLKYDVEVTDVTTSSLIRMKKKIYKKRYGKWDNKIKLIKYDDIFKSEKIYDLIIIGTPPITHFDLTKLITKRIKFKKILIEKPLSTYLENFNIRLNKNIFCGYNHSVSKSFQYFVSKIRNKKIDLININWKEGFSGILNAHFWMKNEFDSYLGDIKQGGGALHEHSHGLHLAVILMEIFSKKKNKIIGFSINKKSENKIYDKFSHIIFKNKNFILTYTTDLITEPAQKNILVSGKNFSAKWICGYEKNKDYVEINHNGIITKKHFLKTRSSEFENELLHINKIKNMYSYKKSYLSLKYAKMVMNIIKKII